MLRPTRQDLAAGGHLLLMTDAGPLDVLGFIGEGRRYGDVIESVRSLRMDGMEIRVLPIEALIAEKKVIARERDLAILRVLEALLRRKGRGCKPAS